MKSSFKIFKRIKYWFLVLSLLSLCMWFMYAADDLLWQIMEPAFFSDTIIGGLGENVETVWNNVFHWSTQVKIRIKKQAITDDDWFHVCKRWECSNNCKNFISEGDSEYENQLSECKHEWKYKYVQVNLDHGSSMISKIIRFLLAFLVAISVTMILYNGMIYIVQTWQGKEWKNLVKNIIYIVVWILIGLFSVVIIRLIQSIPYTLEDETTYDVGNTIDNSIIESE